MKISVPKTPIMRLWQVLLISLAFVSPLIISQPLMAESMAGLTAEHLLSIKAGLNQPTDTAISSNVGGNGDIYILNGVLSQIMVFSKNGKHKFTFGKKGKGDGELNLAMAISIKNKSVYIADTGNARISIFNLQGKFISHIILSANKVENNPVAPVALLILENKIIWSDRKNHQLCVTKIDNGKTLNCWGTRGDADGQFNYPFQLAIDKQGYIFTIDVLNARVQAFSRKGKHFMNIGRFGVNATSLFRPNGLALTEDNYLLVSDAYFGTLQVYKDGRALGLLKHTLLKHGLSNDAHAENLIFKSPTSLTLFNNKLYITDTLNNSIEIYQLHKTQDNESTVKLIKKPESGSSRKNCVICHVSWADDPLEKPWPRNNDYDSIIGNQTDDQIIPVAHEDMCYSCHHGAVIDSRDAIGDKYQHPDIHHRRDNAAVDGSSDEEQDKIAKEFPLISDFKSNKKELYCGSCHTPHKFETQDSGSPGKHNISWMRETNHTGEICLSCHQSKIDNVQHEKRETRGVNHPIGIYLKHNSFSAENSKLSISRGGTVFETVGSMDATVKPTGMYSRCVSNTVPPRLIESLPEDKNNTLYARDENLHDGLPEAMMADAMLGDKQQIICQSCHKVHGSDEQQLTVIKANEMCVSCHQRHNAEDIESARKKGVHPVNIKLEEPVKINDKEIEFISCATCHSAHNGKPDSALLVMDNKNGELCNICHEDYKKLVNTDHDLRLSARKSKNRYDQMPEQISVCGSCHSMHEAEESANNRRLSLDATVENPYQGKEKPLPRDQMCLNCHHKDGAADKAQIKYFSHPTKDMILRSNKKIMPLLDKNNKISEFGEIACITCHNPHRWSAHKDIKESVIAIGMATATEVQKNQNKGDILSSFLHNKEIHNSFCKDCHGIETKIKYKYYHLELSR